MIKTFFLFIGSLFLLIQYACSPAGVLASGGATTMVIAEGDRSLGTVVDDATIKLNISGKFLGSENNLFLNIDSRVIEGLTDTIIMYCAHKGFINHTTANIDVYIGVCAYTIKYACWQSTFYIFALHECCNGVHIMQP